MYTLLFFFFFIRFKLHVVTLLFLDPLDANARKLIKSVCNKWRGKSIYQVIMLDRAKKLQDVVYFSLQVSS